ncbi:hypothetical protein M8818_004461 [Zalaria obscura]|uniref:Uncharacterized protein n=1 Tax=Zalaria obscura TaxID=2024903 RepID=A0ACC3SC43_9PEZI
MRSRRGVTPRFNLALHFRFPPQWTLANQRDTGVQSLSFPASTNLVVPSENLISWCHFLFLSRGSPTTTTSAVLAIDSSYMTRSSGFLSFWRQLVSNAAQNVPPKVAMRTGFPILLGTNARESSESEALLLSCPSSGCQAVRLHVRQVN